MAAVNNRHVAVQGEPLRTLISIIFFPLEAVTAFVTRTDRPPVASASHGGQMWRCVRQRDKETLCRFFLVSTLSSGGKAEC